MNSKNFLVFLLSLFAMGCATSGNSPDEAAKNWTHFVRIAGHGVNLQNVDEIIKSAIETNVFGIEIDNSLTGYYESFLDPEEKLKAIQAAAEAAHQAGNKAFIYTEGLETITSNANEKEHTFFKDHPDWVQRDITGRPAVFGGGTAFWISEGDEDVWISPYAKEWRKIFMERVRQIAATGIDGIFIDIPYWMTHFKGWQDTWASFDQHTVAAFKERTGIDAMTAFELGDFNDPDFVEWVDFRIETLTEFMAEVSRQAKSVNPNCMVIAEIYPGLGESAVRVGVDVHELYKVVDVIAHEYSGGGGNAAAKNPLDWFSRMAGMYTFRAFANGKASWMLSYSWGPQQETLAPADPMKNLALSNVMAGANCWDAARHVMSGSNDYETRKTIFQWIGKHEKVFYQPRRPIEPVGVYFSPKTRNYFSEDHVASFKGMLYLFLQQHREFQIVTPQTLASFDGKMLILPDVKSLGPDELDTLEKQAEGGMALIVTGESGDYDLKRRKLSSNHLHEILATKEPEQSKRNIVVLEDCPGRRYYELLAEEFNAAAWTGSSDNTQFDAFRREFFTDLQETLPHDSSVLISASPFAATQTALVDDMPHVFIANFKGLKRNENAVQLPENQVNIEFQASRNAKVFALPFLGELQEIKATWQNEKLNVTIPEIQKGMVVWVEE